MDIAEKPLARFGLRRFESCSPGLLAADAEAQLDGPAWPSDGGLPARRLRWDKSGGVGVREGKPGVNGDPCGWAPDGVAANIGCCAVVGEPGNVGDEAG